MQGRGVNALFDDGNGDAKAGCGPGRDIANCQDVDDSGTATA